MDEKNLKLINKHVSQKRESEDYKKRRFLQWNENYALYRDLVKTNRLTQRQPINIPIMRESVQTWISKIDEPPMLSFAAKGSTEKHKIGEMIVDELWKHYYDKLSLDIMDNMDKKVVGLQGRSFKVCGISKGDFFVDIIDPYDIEIDPKCNILDLNSAQYLKRTHIFRPLREILANVKYDEVAKQNLKIYLDTKEGIIQAGEAREAYIEKMARLRDLGAENFDDHNASDVLVELNESYDLVWNAKENRFVRHFIVFGADKVVLFNKPIKEARGLSRVPIVTWADDPDVVDIWCDGKGDSVRTVNKVVNMYISQDVENRAYQGFGMRFYNTLNGTFQPRAFDPKPFGMYGVPGNPKDIIQEMEIPQLGDTSNQIAFLKDMIQSSIAQTPTERGISGGSRETLGQVEINLQQSQGRNTVSSKHYRRAWQQIGEIFYELMSTRKDIIILDKKGPKGDYQTKKIMPSEWQLAEGYNVEVTMKADKDIMNQNALQKSQFIIQNFQDNPVALIMAKRKQLETLDLTPDEIDQAIVFEEQKMGNPMQQQDPALEGGDVPAQEGGRPFGNNQVLQQETA